MKIDFNTHTYRSIAWLLVMLEPLVGWPWLMIMIFSPVNVKAMDAINHGAQVPFPLVAGQNTPETAPTIPATPSVEPRKGHDEGVINVQLQLKAEPSDIDLQMARIFGEPLVPMGDQTVKGENAALAKALKAYVNRKDKESVKPIDDFLQAYPNTRWKVALQTNAGILRRKAGYFTEALARLEEAWALGKADTTVQGHALADRALGELADLNARFGRYERMKELFDEVKDRDLTAYAQTLITGAKDGYWKMTEKSAEGFRCGPFAVNAVLDAGKKFIPDPTISEEPSSQKGTNLKQLKDLSAKIGLNLVPARKTGSGQWVLPMVVHWKVGHFAAVLREEKGKYYVKDPTFGGEIWVSPKALDTEGSGYGMVLSVNGKLPKGWTAISDEEAAGVWGKGGATNRDCPICETSTGGCCAKGMAQFAILKMEGTLQITDFPVGYKPPVGPEIEFMVRYRNLDAGAPTSFTWANFGSYWTSNWFSYLEVDGAGSVTLKGGTGGVEVSNYSTFNQVLGTFARSLSTGTVIHKTNESQYERIWSDGSQEVFAQPDGTGRLFLKKVIDPQGNTVTLNYDAGLRVTSIVDAIGQSTAISYKSDTVGNAGYYKVYRVTDPFGRYAEFTYDGGLTRLQTITDVIGIQSSFIYGSNNSIAQMTTPYGNTSFYPYAPGGDGTARGIQVILPDGSQEALESYTGHEKTTYYWDRKAMALAAWDRSKAEQTNWLMNTDLLMMAVPFWTKKALESQVDYEYPDQPSATHSPGDPPDTLHNYVGSLQLPSKITRTLDDNSQQIYQFEYNDLGRVTKSIDPLGRTFSLSYAVNGIDLMEVRQTKGSNNDLLAKIAYNSQHLPLTETDASGRTTSFTFNTKGQPLTITNAKGEIKTMSYDSNGYLTRIDGPLSGSNDRSDFTYDSYGRLLAATAVQGPTSGTDYYTLTYSYDNLDRVTQVLFPDSTTIQKVYSRLDMMRSKDRLGRWTQYIYDALGERISERDPAGRTTQYEWCRCGALQGLADAAGNVTKWTYDVQGRMTRKTYADGTHQDYEYETNITRLKKLTDPAGNATNYSYNLDNTLAGTTCDPVSGFSDVLDISVVWDANYRRVSSIGDTSGTYAYSYNAYVSDFYGSPGNGRGRLATIAGPLANSTIGYEYDELGRLVDRKINGTANEATWAYDAAGRLSSWANALGTFTPSYVNASYGVSRFASVAFPNSQVVNYDWENNAGDFRLKEIESLGSGSTPVSKFDYVTDAIGRILQWTQQKDSATPERYDLGYDAADELVSAVLKNTSTGATIKENYYAYDAVGNRTSEQVDATVISAGFNNLNQLTSKSAGGPTRFKGSLNEPGSVTVAGQSAWMSGGTNFQANPNLTVGTNTVAVVAKDASNNTRTNSYQVVVPSGASATLTYDANGNLLSDGDKTYGWDAANRLVKITFSGGATSEFTYDVFGRRVKIVEKASGGTVTSTKQFVWNGLKIAEQRDGGNAVTKRYFNDGWQDTAGSANYFYTKDHLGSIREVTDGTSAIVARYDYDLYGRTTKVSGSADSDELFTGHYYHQPSGLYLAPYRAYSPNLGRWISRDPLENAELLQGANLYTYCASDPANYIDPEGLERSRNGALLVLFIIIAIVAFIACKILGAGATVKKDASGVNSARAANDATAQRLLDGEDPNPFGSPTPGPTPADPGVPGSPADPGNPTPPDQDPTGPRPTPNTRPAVNAIPHGPIPVY